MDLRKAATYIRTCAYVTAHEDSLFLAGHADPFCFSISQVIVDRVVQ